MVNVLYDDLFSNIVIKWRFGTENEFLILLTLLLSIQHTYFDFWLLGTNIAGNYMNIKYKLEQRKWNRIEFVLHKSLITININYAILISTIL